MRIVLLASTILLISCIGELDTEAATEDNSRAAASASGATQPGVAAPSAESTREGSAAHAIAIPQAGECAFNRSDGQYVGPIVEVGPLGHRDMADQRAIWVSHPQIGRMDVTYPRNATVGPCP